MVALTPHFTSLLAFVISSSVIVAGVEARPYRPDAGDMDEPGPALGKLNHNLPLPALVLRGGDLDLEARGRHHHHHHHGHHRRDAEALDLEWNEDNNVYNTEDPTMVSGTDSQFHAHKRRHSHHGGRPLDAASPNEPHKAKRRHRHRPHHHGDHHRHGHGTKVYADDPLVVSGDNNHVHAHSHKRDHRHHHGHGHHRHGHGHHRHHNHHDGTKVYADDPVIVSGDNNHVHTHSHKRDHHHDRHHGDRHRHGHHKHHDHHGHHSTAVYADDPIVVSGDKNHVHTHSHKRRAQDLVFSSLAPCKKLGGWFGGQLDAIDRVSPHHPSLASLLVDSTWQGLRLITGNNGVKLEERKHHGHHHHHHHHQGTPLEFTVFKRQPRRRGFVDPLLSLLEPIPGVAGIIDIVNTVAHTALSERLASLIISSKPSTMGTQSVDGEQLPGYTINASNSTSTTMYLVPQDTPVNLRPSEKAVLITMPVLQLKDESVKMYCVSYDPNSVSPSQLSSQPCAYNANAGLDTSNTSTHFSQLFSWNIEDGMINPLWLSQTEPALVDTTNAPGGAPDPVDMGGYIVGGASPISATNADLHTAKNFGMIFRASPGISSSQAGNSTEPAPSSPEAPTTSGSPNDITEGQAATYPDEEASMSDPDTPSQASQDNEGSHEKGLDIHASSPEEDDTSENSKDIMIEEDIATARDADPALSTPPDGSATPSTTSLAQVAVITSTFTMLVAPTQSLDASDAAVSMTETDSSAAPADPLDVTSFVVL